MYTLKDCAWDDDGVENRDRGGDDRKPWRYAAGLLKLASHT